MANLLISGFARARRLTLRTTLRLSFVGGLLSLLTGSFVFLDTHYLGIFFTSFCCAVSGNRFEQLGNGILVAYFLIGIVVLPLVAQSVAHDTSTELFQFMQLTGISSAKIIKAYFLGALVRLRFLIMFMIISMPFALLFLLRFEIEMRAYHFQLSCLNWFPDSSCINSSDFDFADLQSHYLLMKMLSIMQLWGMLLAGISLGIAIGLVVRRRVAAILISVVVTMCIFQFVLTRPIPVEVDLINYLWPYGVTILVLFLPQAWDKLHRNYRAIR